MNLFTPFFILSAADSRHGLRYNVTNHAALLLTLRKLGYAVAECTGRYGGALEKSILVIDETPSSPDTERTLLELARHYGQEAILAVDANRAARLIPLDRWKRPESLGQFTCVSREDIAPDAGWTCRAGRYYVCI